MQFAAFTAAPRCLAQSLLSLAFPSRPLVSSDRYLALPFVFTAHFVTHLDSDFHNSCHPHTDNLILPLLAPIIWNLSRILVFSVY